MIYGYKIHCYVKGNCLNDFFNAMVNFNEKHSFTYSCLYNNIYKSLNYSYFTNDTTGELS